MTKPEYVPVSAAEMSALVGLDDWRYLASSLQASFRLPTFTEAAALVHAIAHVADMSEHHPEVHLRHPGIVHVDVRTHVTGGVTVHDVGLAHAISRLAAEAGAVVEPALVQTVELAIDTADASFIRPFWSAVLGYEERNGALFDPRGLGPSVWFQPSDESRPQRNRVHVDVYVADDEAEQRVSAALAAGGRLVTDRHAPAWWVLADAEGNEACVCTWQDAAT